MQSRQEQHVKIFFHDEAPRIGSGWRYVTAHVGYRWVRVRDARGRTVRFTHDQYRRLRPVEITGNPKSAS